MIWRSLLWLLLLAIPASAEDKAFWTVTGFELGAMAYDIESTRQAQQIPGVIETNPLLGQHPSSARAWATLGAENAGAILLGHILHKKGFKAWWLPQLYMTGTHIYAGSNNFTIVWGANRDRANR